MKPTPRQLEALQVLHSGQIYPELVREEDGRYYARWRGLGGDNLWIDELARKYLMTPLSAEAEKADHPTLHDAWMAALASRTGLVDWDAGECAQFAQELAKWRERLDFTPLEFAFDSRQMVLSLDVPKGKTALRTLGEATGIFGPLRRLKLNGKRLEVALGSEEAAMLVRSGARRLIEAGHRVTGLDLKAEVETKAVLEPASPDTAQVKLEVRVAGEVVGAEEIRRLLSQHSTLVFFRDRWIEVDVNILKMALRALEKAYGMKLDRNDAVFFACGLGRIGALELKEVAAKGWVRGVIADMKAHGGVKLDGEVPGFRGELRDYQRRGVAWLKFMTDHGFGPLLADDMGLGKTAQTIGWILKEKRMQPVLVSAPLTLVENWRKELARFAPSLKVYVHSGEARQKGEAFAEAVFMADVVVTGYSLLVKDYGLFAGVEWHALVLDEAQAIKNAKTKLARAVCRLRPARRIALTGTPVENSLSDLWSLEEFLNPGLLGPHREFELKYVKPLAGNPMAAQSRQLKRALEPFVLRRLKTEPAIAGELGGKREQREYCTLSPKDRERYETALADFRRSEHRQGDIFALITSLKLICDGEGKLEHLLTLLENIFAAGESALVFTQYAKVGAVISRRLATVYGRRFPFLHGALTAKAREREIQSFNAGKGPSVFVLSLRAGGFGLNLTKATHVIHFDRWWNPAVENQATDRAHRLGQDRNVTVHTLITAGTVEERVDEILERKGNLADIMGFAGEEFFKLVELEP